MREQRYIEVYNEDPVMDDARYNHHRFLVIQVCVRSLIAFRRGYSER